MERYLRNIPYVDKGNQFILSDTKVFIAGLGLGSVIAECALRLGFENLLLADYDIVEESNLNRQNYTFSQIGKTKAECVLERLKSINPNANITIINDILAEDNIKGIITNNLVKVAINSLDFTSSAPFIFDDICNQHNIPVLHPYNLGWSAFVTVIADNKSLRAIDHDYRRFELKVGRFIISKLSKEQYPAWLNEIISDYENKSDLPYPQLSVSSWIIAGLCSSILYKIATSQTVKVFPDFYYLSALV